MSGLNITKDLQDHIDFLKSISTVVNVEVDLVPISWRQQLNNIDSLLFKIYDDKNYIDLVVPKSICKSTISPYIIENKEKLESIIKSFLNTKNNELCLLTKDNNYIESFFFLNPETNIIVNIDNVVSPEEQTDVVKELLRRINQFEFIKDPNFYEIYKDEENLLFKCTVLYDYIDSATYRFIIPKSIIDDVTSHDESILNTIQDYYENTKSENFTAARVEL